MDLLKVNRCLSLYQLSKNCPTQSLLLSKNGSNCNIVYKTSKRLYSSEMKNHSSDKVILHQFVRGRYIPSLSPFPMKVETYLRINDIPYANDFKKPISKKGKSPWITYKGENIADSHFILEFLNKEFQINMNKHLSESDKSIAKSFRHLLEDHLYWTSVYDRWVLNGGQGAWDKSGWPNTLRGKIIFAIARRRLTKDCWSQGTGRHSADEIAKMTSDDVKALSSFIGNKDYLMGDKICEEDCSIFSFVAQLYNRNENEIHIKKLLDDNPNLEAYFERIKSEYWPDWEKSIRRKKK